MGRHDLLHYTVALAGCMLLLTWLAYHWMLPPVGALSPLGLVVSIVLAGPTMVAALWLAWPIGRLTARHAQQRDWGGIVAPLVVLLASLALVRILVELLLLENRTDFLQTFAGTTAAVLIALAFENRNSEEHASRDA